MEALMAGIPVIATDTGGTAEILEPTFGIVLNRELDEHTLADAIRRFEPLSIEQQLSMRAAAASYARQHCNAAALDKALADRLCTLVLAAKSK
jgi:glycosyltransferase involved in cell wall biosynthesis